MLDQLKPLKSMFAFDAEFDVMLTGAVVVSDSLLTRGTIRLDQPYSNPVYGIEKEHYIVLERCSVGHERLPEGTLGRKACRVRITRAGWIKSAKYLVVLKVEQIKESEAA